MGHCVGKEESGLSFSKKTSERAFVSVIYRRDGRTCLGCQVMEFCIKYNSDGCK